MPHPYDRTTLHILEVSGLKTYFYSDNRLIKAVDDVSFSVKQGETLGIVGESGCGKSATALSILRLVSASAGQIVDGQIRFHGDNLLEKSESAMEQIRGGKIAMVFQEPMTSLNPVYTIGQQIVEAIRLHSHISRKAALEQAIESLALAQIPAPEQCIRQYPHELSGGMRQRALIAMALSCKPELLICDEPTTALDVTIQAQILELLERLQTKTNTTVLMITHDLGVIAELAHEVLVMYAGKVVEYGDVERLFTRPLHPYTQWLLACIPRISGAALSLPSARMALASNEAPAACAFAPRCADATPLCKQQTPELVAVGTDYAVRCFKYNAGHQGQNFSQKIRSTH
ncbi:MAG: ABC transporter ATP-binding protein [Treponema sp.]|jgi:peptide/nickel transport system ATP-binding protein/oligopeptide transport system ATP-binding protein|nr:ABC transporter ATP-binding protein [Treponema sp.]